MGEPFIVSIELRDENGRNVNQDFQEFIASTTKSSEMFKLGLAGGLRPSSEGKTDPNPG